MSVPGSSRFPREHPPFPRFRRRLLLLRRNSGGLIRGVGVASVLLGALVLLGWALDIRELKSVLKGAVQMKANAALAFMLCGLSLILQSAAAGADQRATRALAPVLGAAVAAIGILTGAEYLTGLDFGIDQWLVRDRADAFNPAKGRMAPASAAAFTCIGVALALLPLARLRILVQGCAGAAAVIGLTALAGYLWGASELRTDEWAPPVAVHTAAGLAVLGATLWLAAYRLAPGHRSLRFLLDPIELKIVASFAGALLLLTVMGGLSYGAAAESTRVARQLAQVVAFHGKLTALYADAADAAVAARTFVLTGESREAEYWMQRVARLEARRRAIVDSAGVTPAERAPVLLLDEAVTKLARIFREALALHGRQGPEAARAFLGGGADRAAMAEVRAALLQVDELARAEEDRQQVLLRQHREETLGFTLLFLALSAFVLAWVFTAIRREMAARSQAERALRRRSAEAAASNRFLESVIQNIPHMIFVKDATQLRFVRINRAGLRLLGYGEGEMLGRNDYDIFPAAQADFFVAKDREVLASGTVLDIPEEEVRTASDGVRLLHTRKIPLLDAQGNPTHLMGIAEDVTDVRHKERQIRELNAQLRARAEEVEGINEARSTFLATMSHEIRTPMNGMLGMLELLSLSPLDEKQRHMVSVIAESGQSLLRIIDDVLDFSKVEAGKLQLHEEVASVACIVEDVRNIHSTVASSKGLAISASLDPRLSPAVWVDPLRLRQILNNFVSNAVKFTRQGQVDIRVEVLESDAQRQLLRLSVSDTGAGISPEDQERLFQPFVQVGAVGSAAAGGTGLGLAISRQLAALMGGSITLRSAVGEGTTLSLLVPVRTAARELLPKPLVQRVAELRQAAEGMRRAPGIAEAEAEGTLVLVVDDHPVNRMLLVQQLGTLGYAAEAAPDAAEGLRRWRSGRFALVLTDCQMPGMDGYELARRIRASEAAAGLERTPVIACTAMALPGEEEKCREAGMDDVMFKPVELRPLLEKMGHWLPLGPGAADGAVPAAPQPGHGAPVDIALLEETWGSDRAGIQAILAAFGRSAREDYGALRDAVARRDAQELMQVAHRMLGASKMVGAHALAEGCQLVNAAGREGSWDAVAAAMQAVDAEYVRVMAMVSDAAA